jgi:hypothetical protein
MLELFFMVFCLAFFLYVIWLIQAAEERVYQRKEQERREAWERRQKLTPQ